MDRSDPRDGHDASRRTRRSRAGHARPPRPGPGKAESDAETDDADDEEPDLLAVLFQQQPHDQLAPRGVEYEAGDPQWQVGAGEPMGLSGHDIRMKEFRRAVLRGYATADVDMFLTEVAVALDSLDPDRRPPAHATGLTDSRPALSPAPKVSPVQGVVAAGGGEDDARAEAERIVAQARASAAALQEQAAQTAEAAIRDAKAHAERGLRNARERAAGLLHDAHDRQQRAARLEAEAELRLAHVEQRLADKARVLADEARRLDAIAAWLARDDVSGSGGNEAAANAAPAHAAPPEDVPHLTDEAGDIVPFKRSAETER